MPRLSPTSRFRRPASAEQPADAAAEAPSARELKLRRQLRQAIVICLVSLVAICVLVPATAFGASSGSSDVHPFITLALTLGGLSLLPFAVMTLTSFLRIVVVLSFLRSGLGAQNVPPNVVVIALSLFLSLFVMGPTLNQINTQAFQPYNEHKISADQAFSKAQAPLKQFMVNQLGKSARPEVQQFYEMALKQKTDDLPSPDEMKQMADEDPGKAAMALPMRVIIPSFIISELKKAFIMGFAVLLPFLVIDMVVSNVLLSLGMFMLSPTIISLPFKILLFVLAGGWTMVVDFLLKGFNY